MAGFCQCGCGQETEVITKTSARLGWVRGKHKKYVQGHQHKKQQDYTVVDRGYLTPCWDWRHAGGVGYGTIRVSGKTANAHRHYYETLVGPIPAGLDIDHLCRNRRCVNPDHMEPVTRRTNTLRGARCNKELVPYGL